MPCAICGRTARYEWLMFHFNRKERKLCCSLCREGYFNEYDIRFQRPPIADLLMIKMAIIILLFALTIGFMGDVFREMNHEFNGPEPELIENVTVGGEYRLYGRVESNDRWEMQKDEDYDGISFRIFNNFTLTQGNDTIQIIMTNETKGYQYNEPENGSWGFENGDLVYVIGTGEEQDGHVMLRADRVMDMERDISEEFGWLRIIQTGVFLMGGFFFVGTLRQILAPFIIISWHGQNKEKSEMNEAIEKNDYVMNLSEHSAEIEKMMVDGNKFHLRKRKILYFFGSITQIITGLMIIQFYILHFTLEPTETNFGLLAFFGLSIFILFFVVIYCFEGAQKAVHWLAVGEEGIMIIKETKEPYLIPWGSMHTASAFGRETRITLKHGKTLKIRTSRKISETIQNMWYKKDMARIVEESKVEDAL